MPRSTVRSTSSRASSRTSSTGVCATRRTALGVTWGGLVVLTGCDIKDLDPRADPSAENSDSGPAEITSPSVDTDAALVIAVVRAIDELLLNHLDIAGQARDLGKPLVDALRELRLMHETHRAVLTDDQAPAGAQARGKRISRTETLRRVRRRERAHLRLLEKAAVDAESGTLAKLLASMSAAVAQRLAVLPSGADGG